jgi:hypothetical protein
MQAIASGFWELMSAVFVTPTESSIADSRVDCSGCSGSGNW